MSPAAMQEAPAPDQKLAELQQSYAQDWELVGGASGYLSEIDLEITRRIGRYEEALDLIPENTHNVELTAEREKYQLLILDLLELRQQINVLRRRFDALPTSVDANNINEAYSELIAIGGSAARLEALNYQIGWVEELDNYSFALVGSGVNRSDMFHGNRIYWGDPSPEQVEEYLVGARDRVFSLMLFVDSYVFGLWPDSKGQDPWGITREDASELYGILRKVYDDLNIALDPPEEQLQSYSGMPVMRVKRPDWEVEYAQPDTDGYMDPETCVRKEYAGRAADGFATFNRELGDRMSAADLEESMDKAGLNEFQQSLGRYGVGGRTLVDGVALVSLFTPAAPVGIGIFMGRGVEGLMMDHAAHGRFEVNPHTLASTALIVAPLARGISAGAKAGGFLEVSADITAEAAGAYLLYSIGSDAANIIVDGSKYGMTPEEWGRLWQNGIFLGVAVYSMAGRRAGERSSRVESEIETRIELQSVVPERIQNMSTVQIIAAIMRTGETGASSFGGEMRIPPRMRYLLNELNRRLGLWSTTHRSETEMTENSRGRVEWNKTLMATDRLVREGKIYVDENGVTCFQGRPLIGRDMPIRGGVYLGAGAREAIVVNAESAAIRGLFGEALRRVTNADGTIDKTRILQTVYEVVRDALPTQDVDAVESLIRELGVGADQKVDLDVFIGRGVGVCRQSALLCGAILELFKAEGYIRGEISVDRNTMTYELHGQEKVSGHAWCRCTNSAGEVIILDVTHGFKGMLGEAKAEGFWDYARSGE